MDNFKTWLKQDTCEPYYGEVGRKLVNFALIKVKKNEQIYLLFGQKNKQEDDIITTDFGFAGLYLPESDHFYYASRDFKKALQNMGFDRDELEEHNITAFSSQITKAVNRRVEEIIDNDVNNLSIHSLRQENYLYELAKLDSQDMAYHQAKYFFEHDMEVTYLAEFPIKKWSLDEINTFLANREAFCDRYAKAYIKENEENILYKLLRNEKINHEYRQLTAQRDRELPMAREIADRVSSLPAKVVQVSLKDGAKLIRFDMDAKAFTPEQYEYAPAFILPPGQARYIDLYGKNPFYASQIESIHYGGRSIYQRQTP